MESYFGLGWANAEVAQGWAHYDDKVDLFSLGALLHLSSTHSSLTALFWSLVKILHP
jgi:hypothetical protein